MTETATQPVKPSSRPGALDLGATGQTMGAVAADVFAADEKAFAHRQAAFGALQSSDAAPTEWEDTQ